jgi:tight adherence protein B
VPPLLTLVLTFVAASLAVAGVYSVIADLFLRDRSRVSRRVDEEFRRRQRARAEKSALFKNLGRAAAEYPEEEAGPSLGQRFDMLVEQSGLSLTTRRLLLIMAGLGLGGGAVGMLLFGLLGGIVLAPAGAGAPLLYVHLRRKARLNKLLAQLPDAFELMARIIRAGQTMSQALQAVADEFELPISAEFGYCYEQQNLGLPPEVALRDLARRTGLLEIKIFVLGLLVQQQTGGNLAELLDKLAGLVRERFRLRGKISALTAEGRMQAIVLLLLPPGIFVLMMLLNWSYAESLLANYWLLIVTFVLELLGALWIRKIVNFDF